MMDARITVAILFAYFAVVFGSNCPDPGFSERSDRYASGHEDQASTAVHEPGDTLTYLCHYGPTEILNRTTVLECQSDGTWSKQKPTCELEAWDRCNSVDGCECDRENKNVSCRVPQFPATARFFPSDTLTLSLYKLGSRLSAVNDFPPGMFENLKALQELYISSSTDEEDIHDERRLAFQLGFLLPITNLMKFKYKRTLNTYMYFKYPQDQPSPCLGQNCYAECGEPDLLNPVRAIDRQARTRTIHALNYDLGKLDNIPGETTLHAQTVHFSKTIRIPEGAKLAIVAREFFLVDHTFSFPGASSALCRVHLVSPGTHGKEKMILLRYGPLTIYAERIIHFHPAEGVNGCHYVPYEPNPAWIPTPSIDQSRAATFCAIGLAYKYPGDTEEQARVKRDTAMHIFNYIAALMTGPKARELPNAGNVLSMVTQAREQVVAGFKNYARYVPFLSQKAYLDLLDVLYESGNVYRKELTRLETRDYTFEASRDSIDLMVQKSSEMMTQARLSHTNAKQVLKVSEKTMENLKEKLQEADGQLAERQADFKSGLDSYITKQSFKAIFNIIKGIGSIVKGSLLKKPAGIGDVMIGVATLGEAIMDVVSLAQRISRIMASNEMLLRSAQNLAAGDSDVSEYVDDLDKAAELATEVIVWDNLVREVEAYLGKGDVATIRGCAQYRLALSYLASLGKALTQETIRQTALIRDALEKKQMLNGLRRENERLTDSLQRSSYKRRILQSTYTAVYFQASDVKLAMARTLREYCLSRFYYVRQECGADFLPRLSDSFLKLSLKINSIKSDAITSLVNPNQPYEDFVVPLVDHGNCTSVEKCPVDNFRKTGQLVVTIPQNSHEFAMMQRVTVTKIAVNLVGATAPVGKKILLWIETSGEFTDSYQGQIYRFTSAPLRREFYYDPVTDVSSISAMVHPSQADYFLETSPYTTWTITMPTLLKDGNIPVNKGVNTTGVSKIELHFWGKGMYRSK